MKLTLILFPSSVWTKIPTYGGNCHAAMTIRQLNEGLQLQFEPFAKNVLNKKKKYLYICKNNFICTFYKII